MEKKEDKWRKKEIKSRMYCFTLAFISKSEAIPPFFSLPLKETSPFISKKIELAKLNF